MTHPLTPREKVAAALDPEIWADDMPVPTRAAVTDFHARRQASTVKADTILTALASGSGDHAELIEKLRFLQPCEDMAVSGYADVNVGKTSGAAADALEALLAENAALRVLADDAAKHSMRQTDKLLAEHDRATEAERKLAEAVQIMEPFARMADEEGGYREDDRLAWGLNRCDISWGDLRAARNFLSKEAERG